ncbi:MAG: ABC transporter ATP-binding protein, partial [Actinomycetia bacterium]|nr:ABC transporter ATP-binding protein [Actinomycetes bacterium]
IDELRDAGVTVVLTTHYMDEAERLADHVHVVDNGRVIASGTPVQLTSSGAENTIRFSARPGLDVGELALALPTATKVVESTPGAYVVTGEIDPSLLATLTAWCASNGIMAERLTVERRTLEDVFLELTGRELR